MVQIVPSILSADFARLAEEVARVERAGVEMIHVDVMDGHFVPNLTLGPALVKSLRKTTPLGFDVHLMITDPDQFAPLFIEAGANQVSIHQEACRHLDRSLRLIQSHQARAGVVINPATPVAAIEEVLDFVDHVLVMSVNPGFGNQKFLPNALHKIRQLDRIRQERKLAFAIEIDGGVSTSNISDIVRAGCDWLVAGSAVFESADPTATVKEMQHLAREATAIKV